MGPVENLHIHSLWVFKRGQIGKARETLDALNRSCRDHEFDFTGIDIRDVERFDREDGVTALSSYLTKHLGFNAIDPLTQQDIASYLAMVIDLYSRRVIGWSMQSRQTTDVVLHALLMTVWRRKPKEKEKVLVHSVQGSQLNSMDWAAFLKHHNLVHSMSRRGNCHDSAVAESFFNLLKREQIRRKV